MKCNVINLQASPPERQFQDAISPRSASRSFIPMEILSFNYCTFISIAFLHLVQHLQERFLSTAAGRCCHTGQ
ncbi:hypothetical protein IE4872_CH00517 [Rhizobium gallicum]|uniref:Uncharacterized protein n=1 Tax=Rhizobium gallicum TaxID=56730 RepID=A0A1L5NE59_9HYPH|nr:hypothetical protein IE4872_CH00517 [Rhizobium gallicum]